MRHVGPKLASCPAAFDAPPRALMPFFLYSHTYCYCLFVVVYIAIVAVVVGIMDLFLPTHTLAHSLTLCLCNNKAVCD